MMGDGEVGDVEGVDSCDEVPASRTKTIVSLLEACFDFDEEREFVLRIGRGRLGMKE